MRDAATRARTREKHDTKTQLKNKLTKPVAYTANGKTEGARHPTGVRPLHCSQLRHTRTVSFNTSGLSRGPFTNGAIHWRRRSL